MIKGIERIKVEITNPVENREEDCFVADTFVSVEQKCEGIPGSARCAICRCKKNWAGIPAY